MNVLRCRKTNGTRQAKKSLGSGPKGTRFSPVPVLEETLHFKCGQIFANLLLEKVSDRVKSTISLYMEFERFFKWGD
jgi:hypothetical protein